MSLSSWLWLCTAAYGVHILEEFTFDWRNWARNVLRLPAEWEHFYVTNALVVVLGVVAAAIAPEAPVLALGFPALMAINATFFHVLPFVTARGRFSPGLVTAIVLFYPLAALTYWRASESGTLTPATFLVSLLIGAALMASPVAMLMLRSRPYFRQDH